MLYTAILSFKMAPCNSEYKFNLTRDEAEKQLEKWRKECGEDNPNQPVFEIFEEQIDEDDRVD